MLGNSIFGSLLSQIPPVPFNSSIALNPSMHNNTIGGVNAVVNGNVLPFSVNNMPLAMPQQSHYGLQLQTTPQQQTTQHFHHSTLPPHQISQHPQFLTHQMQQQQQPQQQAQPHHQQVHLAHQQQQAQPQHVVQTQAQSLNNMKNMTLMANFMNVGIGHPTNVGNSVTDVYSNNSGGHVLIPSNQQQQVSQQPHMVNNILPNSLSTAVHTSASTAAMQNSIHSMITVAQQPQQQQQCQQLQPPSSQPSVSANGMSLPHINSGLSTHHQSSSISADSKSLSYTSHSIESTIDQIVTHTIQSTNDPNSGQLSSQSKQNKSSKENSSYVCNLCSKTYRYRHSLKQHMQQVHLNQKRFSCSECGASFKRKQQLQRHIQSGHNQPQQVQQSQQSFPNGNEEINQLPVILGETTSYHCPHCSHMFQTQDIFLLHLRTNHMKPVKNILYHCEFCEHLVFKNKTSLVRHRRKEHPDHQFPRFKPVIPIPIKKDADQFGDGNVSTDNNGSIGSSSAPSAVMSTPETSHFGSNGNHTCSACGKRFVNRYGLRRHERIHTGERPHECEVCGLSFMEKSHMKQHQMTHTGETLFHCDVCKRGFNRKYSYQRHLLWHAKCITVPFEEEEQNIEPIHHVESGGVSTTPIPWGSTANIGGTTSNFSSYQIPVTSGASFTMQLAADAT